MGKNYLFILWICLFKEKLGTNSNIDATVEGIFEFPNSEQNSVILNNVFNKSTIIFFLDQNLRNPSTVASVLLLLYNLSEMS